MCFDAVNRFYVAEERHVALAQHFRLPPNCFDRFRLADSEKDALTAELAAARDRLARVRTALRRALDEAEG